MSDQELSKSGKRRRRGKVKFDTEIVSKEEAQKLLENNEEKRVQKPPKKQKKKKLKANNSIENVVPLNGINTPSKNEHGEEDASLVSIETANQRDDVQNTEEKKLSKKKKKKNNLSVENGNVTENTEPPKKKKKRKDLSDSSEKTNLIDAEEVQENEELDPANPKIEKTESIRARKRKRHQQLLEEKKLKAELNFQQKCLNYLSQWKHSKSTWKFEKLKQIWIQKNMFNDAKIPEEFWDSVVEYFNNAKGKIKSVIMGDALKIIENDTESKEEDDEERSIKYKRARFIIQNLQE